MYGLNTKVKVGGTWKVTQPHVKTAGTWKKVKIAYAKAGGTWGKTFEYEWVYTFAAGTYSDVDIDTLAGMDKYHNVRIVIPSTVTIIASSTSAYALKTGSGYAGTLTIQNSGTVLGRGGDAGTGGHAYANNVEAGGTGGTGGDAIHVESNFSITNTGTISGGGGGGGGGGGIHKHQGGFYSPDYSSGGGGGGGIPYGIGGTGSNGSSGTVGASGTDATLSAIGTGGVAYQHDHVTGGRGGDGGTLGSAGATSGSASSTGGYSAIGAVGVGGAAGAIYYNPSSFTIS